MKTMFLAIASMTLGTVLGFLVCGATARRLHRNTHGQRTALKARDDPKKMGVMDKVLVLEGVILVAYTAADLAVFLPDYRESRGAMVEWAYCQRIGKDCAMYLDMTGGRTQ